MLVPFRCAPRVCFCRRPRLLRAYEGHPLGRCSLPSRDMLELRQPLANLEKPCQGSRLRDESRCSTFPTVKWSERSPGESSSQLRGHPRRPSGEPSPCIAATGNGRKIVELGKQFEPRQPLHYAEGEGRAPDAAAGKAEGSLTRNL
jgi:hypothetical protein